MKVINRSDYKVFNKLQFLKENSFNTNTFRTWRICIKSFYNINDLDFYFIRDYRTHQFRL